MFGLASMPISGIVVIVLALIVFVIALVVLFATHGKYRKLQDEVAEAGPTGVGQSAFVSRVREDFVTVYSQNGVHTNTPGIIDTTAGVTLRPQLLAERFLANAVSLLVTLGLFGTFLGLMLSVGSLSELIGYSGDSGEWINALSDVHSGLVSALSGMGVAFSTSLAGVACAIILTIMRTIFNPQAQREKLQNMTELWLDHSVASTIVPETASDDITLVAQLKDELRQHAASVQETLSASVADISRSLSNASSAFALGLSQAQQPLNQFDTTVKRFNENVGDFMEFNQNLRNNIERMDVNFIRLTEVIRDEQKTKGGQS